MNKPKLDEIKARLAAATPGPWSVYNNGFDAGVVAGLRAAKPHETWSYDGRVYDDMICGGEPCEGYMDPKNPNTIFIANAPTDVAILLAEIENLQMENAAHAVRANQTTREAALAAEIDAHLTTQSKLDEAQREIERLESACGAMEGEHAAELANREYERNMETSELRAQNAELIAALAKLEGKI